MKPCLGLLTVILVGVAAVPAQDTRKDQELLQGNWVMVSREFMGKKATEDEIKKLGTRVVIKGDAITISALDAGTYEVIAELTFKLDPETKPKSMDLTALTGPAKGKKGLAIYELDDGMLKVCYAIDEPKRPTKFAAPGDTEWILVAYKREKK